MSKRSWFVSAALYVSTGGLASAQEAALSFTRAQVEQGRAVYDASWAMCHGENLNDGPLGAPLNGDAVLR